MAKSDFRDVYVHGEVVPEASGGLDVELLKRKLSEAELLLSYAVETGVHIDDGVVRSILEAGAAHRSRWTEEAATNLLRSEATLAAMLKPVSAESLRSCANYHSKSLHYRLILPVTMGILAAVIVLYSTLAFLFSSFSENIRSNLDVANPLAVRLVSELGMPAQSPDPDLCLHGGSTAVTAPRVTGSDPNKLPEGIDRRDVIHDLQTFAAAIRDMYSGARRVNRLYLLQIDPFGFAEYAAGNRIAKITKILELPPGLPDLALAATERVCVYQRARYYAQSTEENAKIFTGAVATCILPVLYALLGAGANILRRLETQLRARTFIREAHSPRFITAAIAGAVVGLFNFGQGVSVSPLAIAFLAGYAVDVFFRLLESMIQTLSKTRDGPTSEPSTSVVKT